MIPTTGMIDINQQWRSPSSYGRHGAPLLAFKHTTINKHTMEEFYIVKTIKKLSLIMFIPYTKAQRIDELSCMFVAGRDGRTANAEHWRQQRQHICCICPPSRPVPLVWHVGHVQGHGS